MLVEISKMSFSYGNEYVLKDITFNIKEGDFVAIIGPNGSGKTTLIKLILGILKPDAGKVNVFGEESFKLTDKSMIGYIPQKYSIDKNFPATVEEIILLKKSDNINEIVKLLNIDDLMKKKFLELSGGQQQKVLIALSLLSNPKLLILDEPTVGVDTKSQHDFYMLLKDLNKKGMTIIIVTHDISLVSKYVKSVLCVNGSICCQGEACNAEKILKTVYGENYQIIHHHHHGE